MTLYRQLIIVIASLFMLLFGGTLLLNFFNTKTFLTTQLESHAQDTATSLGLSLSPHMAENDIATMTSMVDALFDRGYYREITLRTLDDQPLIERTLEVQLVGIPRWFIDTVPLTPPTAGAVVMAGWHQAGTVVVQSHPGYAYSVLWQMALDMFVWFTAAALLAAALGAIALRILLRPLRAVEQQAEGICERRYEMQTTLPRTRELRRMVLAMNRMTEKVKASFEEQAQSAERLRRQAYSDPVTGLGNRQYFDAQLREHTRTDTSLQRGALLLIQISNLAKINDESGFAKGDQLIQAAGNAIRKATADCDASIAARLTGGDFILLLPNCGAESADKLAERLCLELAALHGQGLAPTQDVANIGVTLYQSGNEPKDILASADLALRQAQSHGPNSWHRPPQQDIAALPTAQGRHEWANRINQVLEQHQLVIEAQKVVSASDRNVILHQEIFVRIHDKNGHHWDASHFLPLAEQLGLAREVDRLVIEEVLTVYTANPTQHPVAINLSPASLDDQAFVNWLYGALERAAAQNIRLSFELAEYGATRNLDVLRQFAEGVKQRGHGIGIDHFGRGFTTFGYLQSLRPDYVKIDSAYTGHASENSDDHFFIATLCNVAHSLDILAIGQGVENEEQWETLRALNLDGIQGYIAGRPEVIR